MTEDTADTNEPDESHAAGNTSAVKRIEALERDVSDLQRGQRRTV